RNDRLHRAVHADRGVAGTGLQPVLLPAAHRGLLRRARRLRAQRAGWLGVAYALGEASANLLQPFWMLPTLAILGLKPRDIMGYTFTMFLACFSGALI